VESSGFESWVGFGVQVSIELLWSVSRCQKLGGMTEFDATLKRNAFYRIVKRRGEVIHD